MVLMVLGPPFGPLVTVYSQLLRTAIQPADDHLNISLIDSIDVASWVS